MVIMLCNGPYFLFFCRGFKLVGPMVIMIYRMLAQDLLRSERGRGWGRDREGEKKSYRDREKERKRMR